MRNVWRWKIRDRGWSIIKDPLFAQCGVRTPDIIGHRITWLLNSVGPIMLEYMPLERPTPYNLNRGPVKEKKIGSFSLIERVILSAGAMLIFSVYFHLTICPEGRKDILKVQYNHNFWHNYTAYYIWTNARDLTSLKTVWEVHMFGWPSHSFCTLVQYTTLRTIENSLPFVQQLWARHPSISIAPIEYDHGLLNEPPYPWA